MGTETFPFWPLEPEKMEFKDGNPTFEIMTKKLSSDLIFLPYWVMDHPVFSLPWSKSMKTWHHQWGFQYWNLLQWKMPRQNFYWQSLVLDLKFCRCSFNFFVVIWIFFRCKSLLIAPNCYLSDKLLNAQMIRWCKELYWKNDSHSIWQNTWIRGELFLS